MEKWFALFDGLNIKHEKVDGNNFFDTIPPDLYLSELHTYVLFTKNKDTLDVKNVLKLASKVEELIVCTLDDHTIYTTSTFNVDGYKYFSEEDLAEKVNNMKVGEFETLKLPGEDITSTVYKFEGRNQKLGEEERVDDLITIYLGTGKPLAFKCKKCGKWNFSNDTDYHICGSCGTEMSYEDLDKRFFYFNN